MGQVGQSMKISERETNEKNGQRKRNHKEALKKKWTGELKVREKESKKKCRRRRSVLEELAERLFHMGLLGLTRTCYGNFLSPLQFLTIHAPFIFFVSF